MASGAVQSYRDLCQAPRAWHYFLQQLVAQLDDASVSLDDYYQELCIELGLDEVTDFPVALGRLLYQKAYRLDGLKIDRSIIYQMWLFFRLNDPVALREYPYTETLVSEFTCSSEELQTYSDLYQGYFLYMFRAFLLTKAREKQLFFVVVNGDNQNHFMIRSKSDFLDIYEITSDIALDSSDEPRLHTIFSCSD